VYEHSPKIPFISNQDHQVNDKYTGTDNPIYDVIMSSLDKQPLSLQANLYLMFIPAKPLMYPMKKTNFSQNNRSFKIKITPSK
jgi:hypothetical protein